MLPCSSAYLRMSEWSKELQTKAILKVKMASKLLLYHLYLLSMSLNSLSRALGLRSMKPSLRMIFLVSFKLFSASRIIFSGIKRVLYTVLETSLVWIKGTYRGEITDRKLFSRSLQVFPSSGFPCWFISNSVSLIDIRYDRSNGCCWMKGRKLWLFIPSFSCVKIWPKIYRIRMTIRRFKEYAITSRST